MRKLIIFFSLMLSSGILSTLYAQQQNSVAVPPVIPPSPDAASLGKYGNISVGLNTGIPDISIPIYTIKTKSLEVPISVSYMATGFKVSEIASWIGLGWSLNAGGVVTRSVVGLPDDLGFLTENNIKQATDITSDDYEYVKGIADGGYDGESDYYFYNFNGRSGKFLYYQNVPHDPLLIPRVPIKVEYSPGQFTIKDEMGIIYRFADIEELNSNSRYFPSSYYLSEITSADGTDHINFTYNTDDGYSETNKTFTETIGQECTGAGEPSIQNQDITNYITDSRLIRAVRLRTIEFSNGRIDFISDPSRLDAPLTRLDQILIWGKNADGSFTLNKNISLGEGYFVSPSGIAQDRYRLKLTGVTEKDNLSNTIKKYSFFYNESIMLPDRTSLAQDWWGNYNGHTLNASLIGSETLTFNGYQYQIGDSNRDPDSTAMQACILKTIVYPTGGYTEFDYEPNYYGTVTPIMAGGLRVKEMRDYEGPGKIPVKKIYKYGSGGSGRGTLLIPSDGLSSAKQEIDFSFNQISCDGAHCVCMQVCNGKRMIISGRPAYELTTLSGSPVVYPEVTVYESNSGAPNGKQVFQFNVIPDEFTYADKAYNNGRLQRNDSWKGGDEIYNASYLGNTLSKLEEIFNTNSYFISDQYLTGTKMGWKVTREGCVLTAPENINDFYYFDYPIYSGVKKLTASRKKEYSSTDLVNFIETQTTYDYSNLSDQHQQLTKKSIITSPGDTTLTKYWYPADYSSSISGTLLNNHIIAIPIKEENFKNNKIISGKVTQYNDFGKPEEIDIYDSIEPQTAPTHNPNQLLPAGYVKRIEFNYDNNQNLQCVHKTDNINTSYIWGYGNSLPFAEIKNAEIGAMSTNFSATNQVTIDITSHTSNDTPITPSFEIFSTQNFSPSSFSVTILGSNGPPNPLLTVKLKNSFGAVFKTINCVWGSNSFGSVSLAPGIYQWCYIAGFDPGGGFNGVHLNITTNYTSQRTGYKTFYTSFEDYGVANSDSHSGTKVWSGIYSLNLPGYNGDYKLSYWKKTGSGAWTRIEQTITVTSGTVQAMNIGDASSIIDDVRIYPPGSEMTTYTYDPLNGISSITDANQNTSYFEYDEFGRLKIIRDKDKNIIKTMGYHYKE